MMGRRMLLMVMKGFSLCRSMKSHSRAIRCGVPTVIRKGYLVSPDCLMKKGKCT